MRVADLAGNAGSPPVGTVEVDDEPPEPLRADGQGWLSLFRAPVGARETEGSLRTELRVCPLPDAPASAVRWEGCPGGGEHPFEDRARLVVYGAEAGDGPPRCQAARLAEGDLDRDSRGLTLVVPGDWPAVCVRQVDAAGNEAGADGGTAGMALVERVEWLATLDHKTAGSTALNPHRLMLAAAFDDATLRQPQREEEATTCEYRQAAWRPVADLGGCSEVATLLVGSPRPWEYFEPYDREPTPLLGQPMAFDPELGRSLYMEGPQTWAWRGTSWRALETQGTPGARYESELVFDSASGRYLLYGGMSADQDNVYRGDTWELDGETWSLIEDGTRGPPPRYAHAMAYDGARGQVVLYGGWSNQQLIGGDDWMGPLWDTWVWDGMAWELRHPEGEAPPALFGADMAYDPELGEVVMYGGCERAIEVRHDLDKVCVEYSDDLWTWNGERWHRLARQGPAPPSRTYHRIVHAGDRLLVFGGFHFQVGFSGYEWTFRDDLWEWDGQRWTERVPEGPDGPPGRSNHAMVYDARRRVAVVAGGMCDVAVMCDGDWLWDGRRWLRVSGAAPDARRLHGLAHDEDRGATVLFGGLNADVQVLGDTWERRSPSWRELAPAEAPQARAGHRLSYVSPDQQGGERVLLFGGCTHVVRDDLQDLYCARALSDLWAWDGERWDRLAEGLPSPPPRWQHGMASDRTTGRTFVYGGRADVTHDGAPDGIADDLWIWDGQGWTDAEQGPFSPDHRTHAPLAWLDAMDELLLFGGETGVGTSAQTWLWDGADWRSPQPGDGWTGHRQGQGLVYDRVRARALVFWGFYWGWPADLAEWDGRRWRDVTPATPISPGARRWFGAAHDPQAGRLVVFGGDLTNAVLGDTWEWPQRPETRPAALIDVDFAFDGSLYADLEAFEVDAVAGGRGYAVDTDPDDDGDLEGEELPGVELLAWDAVAGRWELLAAAGAGVDVPVPLHWQAEDAATATRLLRRRARAFHLALRPAHGEGNGPEDPQVLLDDLEVRVRYRWVP